LSVTFWGSEFFKDVNDQEVKYGTAISTKIFRQINPAEAARIDEHIPLGANSVVLAVVCICIIGAQLPTWMFINSLSLIVHTALLNSMMPPNVWYVFIKYLNLVRLNWEDVNEEIEENYEVIDYPVDQGLYSIYLESSDFKHLFVRNLAIIIPSAIVILIVWALLRVFDRFPKTG
jgi:hypothetical protein